MPRGALAYSYRRSELSEAYHWQYIRSILFTNLVILLIVASKSRALGAVPQDSMTSLIEPSPYLASLQNNIRARPIPWDGAVRAGNLADEQLKKIKSVDKVRKEQRKQNIEGDLQGYTTLLIGGKNGTSVLEKAAKRTDIIQYVLVLAADLISGMRFPSTIMARVR